MTTELVFDFAVPYDGAAQFIISNKGNTAHSIKQLTLVTNTDIGSHYGTLSQLIANISTTSTATAYTHLITLKQPLLVQPGESYELTYSTTEKPKLGILDLTLAPRTVSVSADGSTLQPIDLAEISSSTDPVPGKRVGGYFAEWGMYGRKFPVENIPVDHINTVKYAFMNYKADGSIALFDAYAGAIQLPKLSLLRQRHPYLHVALSFGGWTLSQHFSPMAANPSARANFVNNAV